MDQGKSSSFCPPPLLLPPASSLPTAGDEARSAAAGNIAVCQDTARGDVADRLVG